ncbi:Nuclear pore complex protein NUP107 [Camellia lanceoleosa]|uniref:Nuclear pore complex protein NUP107 n=1 Tax=Camellia lanceoleosa TaxID=1840588 RepID=A0ACC0IL23_9ERIC|nr:Nuclear pore complex protein NUP107 [Camellia lanceoleosa]
MVRGSHVGTYLSSSGVWRHTQRALKKGVSIPKTVHHLDFDAPTCEHAEQLPDDKQDESLLEDVWTLLRAGRLEEACDLCQSAGQQHTVQGVCSYFDPTETPLSTEDHDASENLREFQDWEKKIEDHVLESREPLFLELHAIAMSGEHLYLINRQLLHGGCLRCLATDGDGLGPHELNDGGILATVIAAGFKGELVRFQAGVTMEISRLDACCCIPEVILRCMQVSVSLVESGNPPKSHDELIELVASLETGFLHLFGQQQLQEFLLLEREYWICKLELGEELPC